MILKSKQKISIKNTSASAALHPPSKKTKSKAAADNQKKIKERVIFDMLFKETKIPTKQRPKKKEVN